ncbi:MAG: NAD(P)H-hydrate dehydratase [Christensenellaceae bacterium]|nr:NAD(P)H-hydrate dehydratase [Christensenellaceae bacterium]
MKIINYTPYTKTINPDDMKKLEQDVISNTGLKGLLLMEHAALALFNRVKEHLKEDKECIIVCGSGNNGGDGYALARLLSQNSFKCKVYYIAEPKTEDAQYNCTLLKTLYPEVEIREYEGFFDFDKNTSLVVDALFGTGFRGSLEGDAFNLIQQINESALPVLAVDVPSGLDSNTGYVCDAAVKAKETITFHKIKTGLLLSKAIDYVGDIYVANIGLPDSFDYTSGALVLNDETAAMYFPKQNKSAHKGDNGKVLIIAGSPEMAGAASIATSAAQRAGAGLVSIASVDKVVQITLKNCPSATAHILSDDYDEALSKIIDVLNNYDSVVIGSGLGRGNYQNKLVIDVIGHINNINLPCVVDADALNIIAEQGLGFKLNKNFVLTPHPKEAARLLGCDIDFIIKDYANAANEISDKYGGSIVLKGACSYIKAQRRIAINTSGSPALAKAGSGDALAGIIAALLANKKTGSFISLALGSYMLGKAAELAEIKLGTNAVTIFDVISELGFISKLN